MSCVGIDKKRKESEKYRRKLFRKIIDLLIMAEKDKKCSKREKVLCRKENEKETKGDIEVGRKVKVSGKKELKLCKEKKLYERKSGIQRIKKVKVGKGKTEYEGGKKERLGRKENERECMKERE